MLQGPVSELRQLWLIGNASKFRSINDRVCTIGDLELLTADIQRTPQVQIRIILLQLCDDDVT